MSALSIDLELFRCPDGYRLARRGSVSKNNPPMDRIVASNDRLIACPSFKHFGSLYLHFAEVETADELLDFVKRFGLLERSPEYDADFDDGYPVAAIEYEGNSVPKFLAQARLFREILLKKKSGSKSVAAFFRSHRREFGKVVSHLTLVADSTGIKFSVTPVYLIDALRFQLGQSLIGSTIVRSCRYCGDFFEAGGPGAKVRSDATFCCHEHSVLYHSHNRSKGDR